MTWFNRICSIPEFANVWGVYSLCKAPLVKSEIKKPVKKEAPKKEAPKKEAPKKEPQEEVKKEEEKKIESSFDISVWKKLYANTKNKREVLPEFWKTFDPNNWSIWKVHYQKYDGEGQQVFMTSNMVGGFLHRMDSLRNFSFGTIGVYGDEPVLEIYGMLLWTGTEIHPKMLEHPSFEYYDREKMDVANEAHRALIEEHWCNLDETAQVEGMTPRDVTVWK